MTQHVTIREETPADICDIESVTAKAFRSAPHSSHTEQFIVNALRAADALTISLVAEVRGEAEVQEIVGYVAVSPVTISDGTTDWYGLGPISVAPEFQGRGIGSELMRAAILRLQNRDAGGCVVLGEPDYYLRFGFLPAGKLTLPGVPPKYFQAVRLNGGMPEGTVAYHPAFNAQA